MVEVTTLLLLTAVAFAGGAMGAAIGALPSFVFTGFIVLIGEVVNISREAAASTAGEVGALGTLGITGSIGFGAGFGPHVAFGGGAAAAAYAARKGKLDTGFVYHEAKNITYSLGTDVDVLLVGGAFGSLGYLVYHLSLNTLALPFDPVAFSVVVTAFCHRVAFGYPLIGEVRGGLLDMSPFERGELRAPATDGAGSTGGAAVASAESAGSVTRRVDDGTGADGTDDTEAASDASGAETADAGVAMGAGSARREEVDPADDDVARRFAVEPWLSHQYEWPSVAFLGGAVGVFSAYLAYVTASPFLGFAVTTASLVFLVLGMERFPVTHHMALPAGLVTVALVPGVSGPGVTAAAVQATVPLWLVVAAGAATGVVGGLFGELSQRVLYAHADTHLDPPAASIVCTTLLVAVLDVLGLFQQSFVPTLGL